MGYRVRVFFNVQIMYTKISFNSLFLHNIKAYRHITMAIGFVIWLAKV